MNRKQLFMNPAETNAHGSIRTAKWAKGAVAVVALSGAFGVASMNTTTASADEIQSEVVAPAAVEEAPVAAAEVVVAEQPAVEVAPVAETSAPVEETAFVEAPATEVATAVEEVAPVAETNVAVVEEVATAPTETVAAEQPAVETANDTSSETPTSDVTAAEVITNADTAKEVDKSLYTITADLDPNNEHPSDTTTSGKTLQTKINLSIKDGSKIATGDYITVLVDQWRLMDGAELKTNDGVVVGRLGRIGSEYDAYAVASVNVYKKSEEEKNKIQLNTNSDTNAVYHIVFNEKVSGYDALDLELLTQNHNPTSMGDRVVDVTATIKDVDGVVLDTHVSKSATLALVDSVNDDLTDHMTANFVYNMTSNVVDAAYYFGGIYTDEGQDKYIQKGTKLVISLLDPAKFISTLDSNYPTETRMDTATLSGFNYLSSEVDKNINGVYLNEGNPIPYKISNIENEKVTVEFLEDSDMRSMQTLFWTKVTPLVLDETVIDTATGQFKPGVLDYHYTIYNAAGQIVDDRDMPRSAIYTGAWATGDGTFIPKYVSTLNAVLEDGTVIKKNMDATGLLKVGETFTLDADNVIEYNGIKYSPVDPSLKVNGATIDKAQVLTKVYFADPQLNHAFVDLTVNHIDKETGAVMKTTTTGNHEETTTYTTNAETFPEYNLVATPDNATGTFGKDAVVVNYYYIHKKGNVVAKFVREDGTEIAPVVNVVTNVNTGTDYTATHPAEIAFDGTVYRYTSTDGSEAGKVTEGTTTITNRYVLVKGTLIEKYVDVNGAEIKAQNTVLDDAPVKTAYSLEHPNEIQANGTTYRYVRTDGAETGQLVEGTTVVTYIYDTVKGDVVVKVVDAKTGNDIFPAETVVDDKPITKTTYDVTSYNKARITGKDGKTWDLVSVDGNQTGKVVEGVTTITFKYNEVKTSVTTKLVSTDGKELRSPSTDADLSTGVTYNTISKAPEVIYATDNNVYKRTAIPSNSQGITTVDPITVTYVYELQTAEPTKTIVSTDGRDLTGKVLLAGDKVVYNFSTDLAKFKGIDGLSTADKQHAIVVVEDIADEFLTPNMSQASVSSGKAFLNYYASIEEAPESIKTVLSAKEVSTTGGFAVLTSFNPLATAEEVKAQNLAFFNEFTNKGLNVSVVLPTTVNATVDNAKIENKVIQIDFDGVTESPVVVNETPDINPTKDIVLNAGDEESLQGKQITIGTVFNYELNGTVYPANRGNKLTSYQQVDKHSDKVLPTGVYLTKATAEIQFEDGYKLGDEIIIPAGTVVKGSWVTPVDIVSDKDGSVIKAGSTVVKDGSPQVEYTIEKDIVVAAGTDVTGIVFPIGSDFSAIFRQFIDAENNTVTYSMRQDAFEKISADSAFGFTTYMQVEQIAAGTTENTYTEIVNGVETKSNTVAHEGVEPEVPAEDTPTPSTPVVNTPGIPVDAPVSAAGVATLPNTGEENSSAAALAGAAMLVATLGLAGRRRKEEK